MRNSILLKALLLVTGATAIVLGGMILFMPHAFYAGYQISPGTDPSLLNEMKSPGLAITGAGFFILSGIILPRLTYPATIVAAALYLSYGASRLISIGLHGLPSTALQAVAAIELATGLLCLLALWHFRDRPVAAAR